MKTIIRPLILVLLLALAGAGCSTQKSVARMQGQGTRNVYNKEYDTVWDAVMAAAAMNDLDVVCVDKRSGYVAARRHMGNTTFGENVGIWLRKISPVKTEVEVVSRRAGPPMLPTESVERRMLKSVGTILPT